MTQFEEELLTAVDECTAETTFEERGGVMIHHPELDQYKFVSLNNTNSGTRKACVLFTADPGEYFEKVLSKRREGWRTVASFHTHPSFRARPSIIDLENLFLGFPTNFIYSIAYQELMRFDFAGTDPKESVWESVDYQYLLNGDKVTAPPKVAFSILCDGDIDKVYAQFE